MIYIEVEKMKYKKLIIAGFLFVMATAMVISTNVKLNLDMGIDDQVYAEKKLEITKESAEKVVREYFEKDERMKLKNLIMEECERVAYGDNVTDMRNNLEAMKKIK